MSSTKPGINREYWHCYTDTNLEENVYFITTLNGTEIYSISPLVAAGKGFANLSIYSSSHFSKKITI